MRNLWLNIFALTSFQFFFSVNSPGNKLVIEISTVFCIKFKFLYQILQELLINIQIRDPQHKLIINQRGITKNSSDVYHFPTWAWAWVWATSKWTRLSIITPRGAHTLPVFCWTPENTDRFIIPQQTRPAVDVGVVGWFCCWWSTTWFGVGIYLSAFPSGTTTNFPFSS